MDEASRTESIQQQADELHSCNYCGKSFTRQTYLARHIRAHKSPALQCNLCKRLFGTTDSLRRHRCRALETVPTSTSSLNTSKVVPRHECPSCSQSYTRRQSLLKHVVRHHPHLVDSDNPEMIHAYQCCVCPRVFATSLSLRNHEYLSHGGSAHVDAVGFSCAGCGRQFVSQLSVDRHRCPNAPGQLNKSRQSRKKPAHRGSSKTNSCSEMDALQPVTASATSSKCSCDLCGRTFAMGKFLQRHMTKVHGDSISEQNADSYVQLSDVDDHLATSSPVASTSNMGHVCSVCGKSLSSVGNLNKHLRIHGPRCEVCVHCGKSFHQRSVLRQHIHDIHAPPGICATKCPTCGCQMRSRTSLYAHIARFHHPGSSAPTFPCTICGRVFYLRSNLRKHEQSHDVFLVYLCPDCPRKFHTASRLRRHQLWHVQGAAYTCAHCERRFVLPGELCRHIRVHHSTNCDTYHCCFCGVCYQHHQMMRRHLARKHPSEMGWQMTDVHGFIESLSMKTAEQSEPTQGISDDASAIGLQTAACSSSSTDNQQQIQVNEVPLSLRHDHDESIAFSSCPPAFLFDGEDVECLQDCDV